MRSSVACQDHLYISSEDLYYKWCVRIDTNLSMHHTPNNLIIQNLVNLFLLSISNLSCITF